MSHERTITVEMDGKHYLIPTVVSGQELSPEEAIVMFKKGNNASLGVFDSADEADAAASQRSRGLINKARKVE